MIVQPKRALSYYFFFPVYGDERWGMICDLKNNPMRAACESQCFNTLGMSPVRFWYFQVKLVLSFHKISLGLLFYLLLIITFRKIHFLLNTLLFYLNNDLFITIMVIDGKLIMVLKVLFTLNFPKGTTCIAIHG